jgi:aerobic-type carbon monoxide dehydrogenase small subunit (CoxS/CutS family)
VVRLQATAKRLLSAAPILRTKEQNQKVFTVEIIGVKDWGTEICSIEAVTAEKNVATVARFRLPSESRFCSYCIAGSPVSIYQHFYSSRIIPGLP